MSARVTLDRRCVDQRGRSKRDAAELLCCI